MIKEQPSLSFVQILDHWEIFCRHDFRSTDQFLVTKYAFLVDHMFPERRLCRNLGHAPVKSTH